MYPLLRVIKTLLGGGVEIHINDLQSKDSSSGSSSKYAPRYFSIDWDKCSDSWTNVFSLTNDNYKVLQPFSTVKTSFEHPNENNSSNISLITQYGVLNDEIYPKGFSYIPVYIDKAYIELCNAPYSGFLSFEQCIEVINVLLTMMGQSPLTLDGITEITEEEYYKID